MFINKFNVVSLFQNLENIDIVCIFFIYDSFAYQFFPIQVFPIHPFLGLPSF